jgi:hypothetical protein
MSKSKRAVTLLLAIAALAVSAPAAWVDAPGPGDNQCRGANGNDNPHYPPGK